MSLVTVLKPRISEKAYGLSQAGNTYVFQVPAGANKLTVAEAVSEQFKVTVIDVNILNLKGKNKRTIRRGGRPTIGTRTNVKKAYVTLKEGNNIAIFANEDDKADSKAVKKETK